MKLKPVMVVAPLVVLLLLLTWLLVRGINTGAELFDRTLAMFGPITVDALALIVLPAPTLKLSTPMRAEPPLNTPTPIRPFWLTCELITVAAALSIATPSRALLSTVQLSTTPLAPWA